MASQINIPLDGPTLRGLRRASSTGIAATVLAAIGASIPKRSHGRPARGATESKSTGAGSILRRLLAAPPAQTNPIGADHASQTIAGDDLAASSWPQSVVAPETAQDLDPAASFEFSQSQSPPVASLHEEGGSWSERSSGGPSPGPTLDRMDAASAGGVYIAHYYARLPGDAAANAYTRLGGEADHG